jgi:excisionase family DNA binding protein
MKKQELPRRYYGVPELARAYNVSDQSIYNLMDDGVIDSVRFGRRRLMPADQESKLDARFRQGAA